MIKLPLYIHRLTENNFSLGAMSSANDYGECIFQSVSIFALLPSNRSVFPIIEEISSVIYAHCGNEICNLHRV